MVLVARLPALGNVVHWTLPSGGARGLDDHSRCRLCAACDDAAPVEIDFDSGKVTNVWPHRG
jgi:hypothetical protein